LSSNFQIVKALTPLNAKNKIYRLRTFSIYTWSTYVTRTNARYTQISWRQLLFVVINLNGKISCKCY
jgi:hypothetical protein